VRVDGETGRDARLAWTDFGVADGPLPDIENRDTWFLVNPALGGRLNVNEVERELSLMASNPEMFARERLGWWGDPAASDGTAFGPGKWEALGVNGIEPIVQAIGLAVSLDGRQASIGAAGMSGDTAVVGAVDRREGVAWLIIEALRLQVTYDCAVVIDTRGPGADLIPALELAGVRLTEAKTTDLLDACATIHDRVSEGTLVHPNHLDLNAAVAGATKKISADRWLWSRRASSGDVSMLVAVTLALWSVTVEPQYDLLESAW